MLGSFQVKRKKDGKSLWEWESLPSPMWLKLYYWEEEMTDNLPYFAWYYVGGIILMALFYRLRLYLKGKNQQK